LNAGASVDSRDEQVRDDRSIGAACRSTHQGLLPACLPQGWAPLHAAVAAGHANVRNPSLGGQRPQCIATAASRGKPHPNPIEREPPWVGRALAPPLRRRCAERRRVRLHARDPKQGNGRQACPGLRFRAYLCATGQASLHRERTTRTCATFLPLAVLASSTTAWWTMCPTAAPLVTTREQCRFGRHGRVSTAIVRLSGRTCVHIAQAEATSRSSRRSVRTEAGRSRPTQLPPLRRSSAAGKREGPRVIRPIPLLRIGSHRAAKSSWAVKSRRKGRWTSKKSYPRSHLGALVGRLCRFRSKSPDHIAEALFVALSEPYNGLLGPGC
jgi:hypothetical protein